MMSKTKSTHTHIVSMLDYTTINLELLRQQPIYRVNPRYRFQSTPGNACFGASPGHPSYFTWEVFNRYGSAATLREEIDSSRVITDPEDRRLHYIVLDEELEQFWKPLPEEHPRVQAWIQTVYVSSGSLKEDYIEWRVRKYYPNHQIRPDWLNKPAAVLHSDWWSVLNNPLPLEQVRGTELWWFHKLSEEDIARQRTAWASHV